MTEKPYSVTIVVDREYGEKLSQLPSDQPVWIVDTPANRAAAGRIWAKRTNANHLTGVTTFKCDPTRSGEEALISEFDLDSFFGKATSSIPSLPR